jgi:hypothetical protein
MIPLFHTFREECSYVIAHLIGLMLLVSTPFVLKPEHGQDQLRVEGLVFATGARSLRAFLSRAQIRPFLLSCMHLCMTQCMVLTRRNHDDK